MTLRSAVAAATLIVGLGAGLGATMGAGPASAQTGITVTPPAGAGDALSSCGSASFETCLAVIQRIPRNDPAHLLAGRQVLLSTVYSPAQKRQLYAALRLNPGDALTLAAIMRSQNAPLADQRIVERQTGQNLSDRESADEGSPD